jgi:signal transduction histidine kinase
VQRALIESLAQMRAAQLPAGRPFLRIITDREPHVLIWQAVESRKDRQPAIIGLVADLAFVTTLFERMVAESPPLLPASLGADTRSFLDVRVANADGQQLFASSPDWSPYASEAALEPQLGGLRLRVALHPTAAEALIIGGLPRSRLPMLVAVIVLTTMLVLIAIIQLRREQELTRLRADFMSSVSHELRTPLAQIRMFGETLLLNRVRSDAERQRSLAIIVQESQRLTRLIENVLHFSRAEHGASSVSPVAMRLDLLLHEIVDGFVPLASSKRAAIVRQIERGLTVPIDAGALRQIVLNLLDNAVKYGPSGQTVTVAARLDRGAARVAVEDQGRGVEPKQVARIWQPFYRGTADAPATPGTGIGLAIVKQLVELHQGRVFVEHGESGGARFIIELPGATLADEVSGWSQAAASM